MWLWVLWTVSSCCGLMLLCCSEEPQKSTSVLFAASPVLDSVPLFEPLSRPSSCLRRGDEIVQSLNHHQSLGWRIIDEREVSAVTHIRSPTTQAAVCELSPSTHTTIPTSAQHAVVPRQHFVA